MCGIAGIVPGRSGSLADPSALQRELERMAQALRHRGPDAQAVQRAGSIGLAHARLAILDLSPTGAQPMPTPDGRFVIAFNGEVYNFGVLRSELEAKGERFAGRSDTEVVLRLLAREGTAALARLDGMFALALADVQTGELLLARDRTGQKPLYVAPLPDGGLAFASEITPLLGLAQVERSLDLDALSLYLTFGLVPAPHTLRRGIRQLRPGEWMRVRAGEPAQSGRFVPELGPREPRLSGGDDELSRRLEDVLSESVRAHLVSDVPIGVLLSGGVDSSTIAALAARHTGRIRTYCVVQRDPAFDEREAARLVASHLGSDHHEVELSDAGLSEQDLDDLVLHHGDPFADSSSINVLRLAREMRRHVTVSLSGDGGDEVFAGYPRFGQLRWLARLGALPRPLLRAASALALSVPGETARRGARSFHIASLPETRRAITFSSWFWPEEQARLLRPEWCAPDAGGRLDALLRASGVGLVPDPADAAHWMEQRLLLPDDMLTKVDRMSMAASLEVRPPILGNEVIDFAARLPFETKLRGATGKWLLRTVARRLVPPEAIDRPKRGFSLNLIEHGGAVLAEATRWALGSERSPLRPLFRPEALAALDRELAGSPDRRTPEDSDYRRTHRRWALVLLAWTLKSFPAG